MVTQTGDIKTKSILREHKMTLYKMHPDQKNYPGLVIEMPNLPFGLRERDKYMNEKGYKKNPQDLKPDAEVMKGGGDTFLVPKGYKLECFAEKVYNAKEKVHEDVSVWRVTKQDEELPIEVVSPEGVKCPECGKQCASDFGLKSHMKSHK